MWSLCGGAQRHRTLVKGGGVLRANEVSLNITLISKCRAPCPQLLLLCCLWWFADCLGLMCTSWPLGFCCFQWLLWWDLSSMEAFGLSHVSLEEQEKQVCSSWPLNRPCTGRQESWISWAMQCCHLPPAGGCLCVQGTSLCPGDISVQGTLPVPWEREHHAALGRTEPSKCTQAHIFLGTSAVCRMLCKNDHQQPATGSFCLGYF